MTEMAIAPEQGTARRRSAPGWMFNAAHGVYPHPAHKWFLNTAHDEMTIDEVLERTDAALDEIRDRFRAG